MWFGLGLITLLVALAASLYVRVLSSWKGERVLADGVTYEFLEQRHKGRLQSLLVGVIAPPGFDFIMREQTGTDSRFKRLGISVEIEVNDREFDDAFYIVSDDLALKSLLQQREDVRAVLFEMLDAAQAHDFAVKSLRCARSRLWLTLKPQSSPDVASAHAAVAPKLGLIADALRATNRRSTGTRDPFVWRAALLLSVSTASAVFGIYGLLRHLFGSTDILDPYAPAYAAMVPGVAAFTAFVVVVWRVLGRSSRTHLVLIEVFLLGLPGFLLSGLTIAREADIAFDTAPAKAVFRDQVRFEDRVSSGKRGRKNHNYYLHVVDWHERHAGEDMRIELDVDTYNRLVGETAVTLYVRPGALGFEWLERVEPATTER